MNAYRGECLDSVWRPAIRAAIEGGTVTATRLGRSLELRPAFLEIMDPAKRIPSVRTCDVAFGIVEFLWMMAGSQSLDVLQFFNQRMGQFSEDGRTLHGAYGYRLRRSFGFDQILAASRELEARPESRQVVLQVWDARVDFPIAGPVSLDVPCSLGDSLLVRDGKLEFFHLMRSNDLIWGVPYDVMIFSLLHQTMAGWLQLVPGPYRHLALVAQVYEHHWKHARGIIDGSHSEQRPWRLPALALSEYEGVLSELWARLEQVVHECNSKDIAQSLRETSLPDGYRQMCAIVLSEALARRGDPAAAVDLIASECGRPEVQCHLRWLSRRYGAPK